MKSMNSHRHQTFQKSSVLFFQLGLILALTITYAMLESYFFKDVVHPPKQDPEATIALVNYPPVIVPKSPAENRMEPKKKQKEIPGIVDIVPNDSPPESTIFDPPITNEPRAKMNPGDIQEAPDDGDDPPFDFLMPLEQVPVFPGCEDLSKEESKLCFSKKIAQFVNKHFNTGLAEDLNLKGKQRIFVQFVIDKQGKVTDIKTWAPHAGLEKETLRVINELPLMKPGMQHLKPVKVRYTLPIIFEVQ